MLESINQSIKKITTYKSDQWYTTHLKTKIKPKDKAFNDLNVLIYFPYLLTWLQ